MTSIMGPGNGFSGAPYFNGRYAGNLTTNPKLNYMIEDTQMLQGYFSQPGYPYTQGGPPPYDPNMGWYNQVIAPGMAHAGQTYRHGGMGQPAPHGAGGEHGAPTGRRDRGLKGKATDIAGFAAAGALVGTFVPIPGVGTGVGAAIGAGVGLLKNLLFG